MIICFGSDLKDNAISALLRATEASVVIISEVSYKRTDFDSNAELVIRAKPQEIVQKLA